MTRRLQLIRILEKMENDPKFSEKLGIKNRSEFIPVSMTGESMFGVFGKLFCFGVKAVNL